MCVCGVEFVSVCAGRIEGRVSMYVCGIEGGMNVGGRDSVGWVSEFLRKALCAPPPLPPPPMIDTLHTACSSHPSTGAAEARLPRAQRPAAPLLALHCQWIPSIKLRQLPCGSSKHPPKNIAKVSLCTTSKRCNELFPRCYRNRRLSPFLDMLQFKPGPV